MSQSNDTLTLITNIKTAADTLKSQLEFAVSSAQLPAQGATIEAGQCQALLDAMSAPAAALAETVAVRTEEAGQTQPA